MSWQQGKMKRSEVGFDLNNPILALTMIFAGMAILLAFGVSDRARLEVDEKSDYSQVRIRRQGDVRTLLFVRDSGKEIVESRLSLDAPHVLMLPYSRVMFASYLFNPQPKRVLIVGLGGGAMVHFLKHYEPKLHVDVVEIDPLIVRLADKYFDMRSDGSVNIILTDGFDYLQNTAEHYDVIYMDAFLQPSADTDSTGVPHRLKTIEFYESIQDKLDPHGVVVFNLNAHADTEEDISTIKSAFLQTIVFRCAGSTNLVAVASMASTSPDYSELQTRAVQLDKRFNASFSFQQILNDRRQ